MKYETRRDGKEGIFLYVDRAVEAPQQSSSPNFKPYGLELKVDKLLALRLTEHNDKQKRSRNH